MAMFDQMNPQVLAMLMQQMRQQQPQQNPLIQALMRRGMMGSQMPGSPQPPYAAGLGQVGSVPQGAPMQQNQPQPQSAITPQMLQQLMQSLGGQ